MSSRRQLHFDLDFGQEGKKNGQTFYDASFYDASFIDVSFLNDLDVFYDVPGPRRLSVSYYDLGAYDASVLARRLSVSYYDLGAHDTSVLARRLSASL